MSSMTRSSGCDDRQQGRRRRAATSLVAALGLALATISAPGPGMAAGPANPAPTSVPTAISAGWNHTCALLDDGSIRCWGYNGAGQLGDGTVDNSILSVKVKGISTAIAISAGWTHTCAILADHSVACWGWNMYGQLGDGTTTIRNEPVPVQGIMTAVSIAAGYGQTCAALANGTVDCWGLNDWGQLGDGTNTNRLLPNPVSGIATGVSVAAGHYRSCAVLADHTGSCWGGGMLGNGATSGSKTPVTVSGLTTLVNIQVGEYHICGLLSGGQVDCWGGNYLGQLGTGTTADSAVPVAAGGFAGAFTTATEVATGGLYGCARLADGTVHCWGESNSLGDGTPDAWNPVTVTGIDSATALAAGSLHTCVVLTDHGIRCWGYNASGQLGDGTSISRPTPVAVIGLTTPLLKPDAPTGVAGTASGSTLAISWRAPASDGGAPVTLYTATVTPGGRTCTSSGALTCSISAMADGTYTIRVTATTVVGDGPASGVSAPVVVDATAPFVGEPTVTLKAGAALSRGAVPVSVAWTATDPGSGIAKVTLERSDGSGTWTAQALPAAASTSLAQALAPGATTYRYRVSAVAQAGNTTWNATGPMLRLSLAQETASSITWSAGWKAQAKASASGGKLRFATNLHAAATFRFTGRAVAWVAPRSTAAGKAKVYVDGILAATVDLKAGASSQRLVFVKQWSAVGPHTLKIVCLATSGRPRIDIDAFVVLR